MTTKKVVRLRVTTKKGPKKLMENSGTSGGGEAREANSGLHRHCEHH